MAQKVLIVKLETTGEVWSTVVCASRASVNTVLLAQGITQVTYEGEGYWAYKNPSDESQTATVIEKQVF